VKMWTLSTQTFSKVKDKAVPILN